MATKNTQPAAPAAKKVVITLEIGEPKKGMRALVISGAPAGEMPLIKSGTFAERHALLDQMWAELLRRPDQTPTITKPKPASTAPRKVKTVGAETSYDKTLDESADETQDEAADCDADNEPATEQPAAGGPLETETDSDQLRNAPVGVAMPAVEPPDELPVIENDTTATPGALEAAIIASKESHE